MSELPPITDESKVCANCMYSQKSPQSQGQLICKRFPPSAVIIRQMVDKPQMDAKSGVISNQKVEVSSVQSTFPPVLPVMHCYEFKNGQD